jgi:hypothetical protein
MTFSDDCLCGRSQHLTFAESNDKIVIEQKTFKQLLVLLGWCTNEGSDKYVVIRYSLAQNIVVMMNKIPNSTNMVF